MNEAELLYAIRVGPWENTIHLFVTPETIAEAHRVKDCPTVRKLAWKKYVASVANIPPLVAEADIPASYWEDWKK